MICPYTDSYLFQLLSTAIEPTEIESLPDVILQYILSHVSNGRDVAYCNCVSKRWKNSMACIRSLYFTRNAFDNAPHRENSDIIVKRMVSAVERLEELVVYCPFSVYGLASWLSLAGPSLSHLELRMDNLGDNEIIHESPSKLDCIGAAVNVETLKLWGVLIKLIPKWETFHNLRILEVVGARVEDAAVNAMIQACPNLTRLLLLGCEGVRSISITLPFLEQCKLDFYGLGNCSLSLTSPKIESLEVQGCSWIRVPETKHLKNLSISNSAGSRMFQVILVLSYFLPTFVFLLLSWNLLKSDCLCKLNFLSLLVYCLQGEYT